MNKTILEEAARRFGTPCYVISGDDFARRANAVKEAFGENTGLCFDKGESVPAEIPAGRVLIYRGMLPGRTEHMRGAFRSDEQGDILRREQNRARR